MPSEDQALIAIRSTVAGGGAIPKVLEMFVARADLSIERLSDAHVIGDFLSNWTSQAVDNKPLNVAISDGEGKVEIRVGPLEPGVGHADAGEQRPAGPRQHPRADHRSSGDHRKRTPTQGRPSTWCSSFAATSLSSH